MFRVLPRQPSVASVIVGGFTRYKTQVADLPPVEQIKLNTVADRIVNGFRTGNFPVVGVLFAGHADQDLARGAAFEREISLERDGRVRDALLRAVQSRAGSGLLALQVKEVIMRTVGFGASQRVFTNPVNETQRATNRRVVMFIADANLPSVSLLGETFPVPRQKHQGAGPGLDLPPAPQRSSLLLAFSVPLFGAPPLAGAPVVVEGPPRRPNIKHDHGFLDDGKGNIDNSKKQSPTDRDRDHKEVWKFLLGNSIQRRPELKDANDAYKHFLVDNNGAQFTVRYDGFLKEDTTGQTVLKSAIDDTRTGVLDVFDKSFRTQQLCPVVSRCRSQALQ
jgi:outer membrane protein OmpA-like peptidoglycan-associated protein